MLSVCFFASSCVTFSPAKLRWLCSSLSLLFGDPRITYFEGLPLVRDLQLQERCRVRFPQHSTHVCAPMRHGTHSRPFYKLSPASASPWIHVFGLGLLLT